MIEIKLTSQSCLNHALTFEWYGAEGHYCTETALRQSHMGQNNRAN